MAKRTIEVCLDDKDVRKDVDSILNGMNSIRKESLAEGKACKQEEYSSLAYRLASCFKGLFDNAKLQPFVSGLESAVKEEPRLAGYDRLQLLYWAASKGGARFVEHLVGLAQEFFQPEDFVQLFEKDGEYHLFQALKVLAKEDSAPVRDGLSLDVVLQSVPLEDLTNPKVIAQAYQQWGYLVARIPTKNVGNVADALRKEGFDVQPEKNAVVIKYKAQSVEEFLNITFGYKKIERTDFGYVVQGRDGWKVLPFNNGMTLVCGYEWFDGAKCIEIQNKKLVELKKRFDKQYRYTYVGGELYLERWFDKPLTVETLQAIKDLHEQYDEKVFSWLLDSDISLEILSQLPKNGVNIVYAAGVKPSKVLMTNVDDLVSRVDNFTDFIQTYEVIQGVEFPEKPSFWQIVDQLVKNDAEGTVMILNPLVEAYKTKGKELKHLLECYQERRNPHKSLTTLLLSAGDYIKTVGGKDYAQSN